MSSATRAARAQILVTYFEFLELRHKVELHELTGRVVECPIDEMNRPRMSVDARLRIPPTEAELEQLFAGWRQELVTCRKFAPSARNYMVARLSADVGLRINEACLLDLDDVRWELGRFGKLNVRYGKGARRKGPRQRVVPLINGADRALAWFIQDVWGQFDADHALPGAPLFPSERRRLDGPGARVSTDVVRRGLTDAVASASAGLGGPVDPACVAALLRQPALSGRSGHHRGARTARPFLDFHDDAVCPRARHPYRRRSAQQPGARRGAVGRIAPMKWNLRLAAANRGVWKASELRRMLAERGVQMSTGKMSGLWSGQPAVLRPDELDAFCAVLGCEISDLITAEPEKAPAPRASAEQADTAVGQQSGAAGPARSITPRPRSGRSLPPTMTAMILAPR